MSEGQALLGDRERSGFTLLELLAVTAVIMLLVGLLAPALASARAAAMGTRCQSTLRQWGVAVVMYAQSNKSYLPRRGQGAQPTAIINRPEDWFNALPPLMKVHPYSELARTNRVPRPGDTSVWMCPQASDIDGPNYFAFGMNMLLSTWLDGKPDRIDRVAPPSVQVFMADGPGRYCSVLPSSHAYSPVARHAGSLNISFLDSHAARFSGGYVGCGIGDQSRGDVRWTVPNSSWPGPGN